MKVLLLGILTIFSFLFMFTPQEVSARFCCDDQCSNSCFPVACRGKELWSTTDLSYCQSEIGTPPGVNYCDTNTWKFSYYVCKTQEDPYSPRCQFEYSYEQYQCSAADTCVSGPYLKPGNCDASSYNGTDPSTACTISSSNYKICCANGTLASSCTGGDHTGTCPTGSTTKFCGFGSYPPCNLFACKPPKECKPSTPVYGSCINATSREVTTNYYYSDGSGLCDSTTADVSDPTCTPKTPPPSPSPSPVELKCNQFYGGVCGCQPGTGCLDGESTDYRCCYRTCDKAAQACVTRAVAGAFPAGTLNNGSLNQCNDNSGCTGNYTGVCQVLENSAAFKVTGPPCSNCSYAKYSDGSFAWQGESISNLGSFTHPVDAGKKFSWYINGKESSPVTCNVKNGQCGQEGCVTDDECDSDYQCEDVCQ